MARIREIAERRKIALQTVPVQGIENIVGKVNHQGVLATTDRFGYTPLRVVIDRPGTVLVLDHITDPQNLGTLLRTARAFDIAGVVIPSDRTASVTPAVVNSSAGAVESLPIAQVVNISRALREIREHASATGISCFALVWVRGRSREPSPPDRTSALTRDTPWAPR